MFLLNLTPAIRNLIIIFIGIVVTIFVIYYLFFAPKTKGINRKKKVLKEKPDNKELLINQNQHTDSFKAVEKEAKSIDVQANPLPISNDFATVDKVIEETLKKEDELDHEETETFIKKELQDQEHLNLENQESEAQDNLNEEETEDAESENTKDELGRYHILYRRDDKKWYIKREGSDKIIRVLETQKEAIAYATIKAINQDTTIVIHKKDGKIRKQNY